MKTSLWKYTLSGGCILAAGVAATAGPLQRADVINDPVWVLHVDCDALRQTAVGKQLLAELDKPEAQKKFAEIQAVFNVDPRKDLHAVTLCGASKAEADVVVLIYADFDAARLTSMVEANKDYESTAHGSNTIHSWIDEKKREKDGVKPRTFGAIHKGKVLIIGQKESRVAAALDALDHSKPSLATSTTFARLGAGSEGAILLGAARKLDLPGSDPGATVLKQAKMFWLTGRETQGRAELKLNLEVESEEKARLVETVGRGLVALLALTKENAESAKLAQGLAIQQEGAGVVVKLSLPAEDVVGIIKAKSGKKAAGQ